MFKLGHLWKTHPTLITVAGVFFAVLVVLVLASIFVYIPYDAFVNGPKAVAIQRDLENEFRLIAAAPNTAQLRCGSLHKTHQGDVTCEYKTDLPYEEIKAHYDRELKSRGWTYVKERRVTIWSHDFGGKQAIYCKGVYDATLQYSGTEPGIEWTFGFTLSWGL